MRGPSPGASGASCGARSAGLAHYQVDESLASGDFSVRQLDAYGFSQPTDRPFDGELKRHTGTMSCSRSGLFHRSWSASVRVRTHTLGLDLGFFTIRTPAEPENRL